RCVDNTGRHFLVEMQMLWTPLFETRVLYNASKAFSQQIIKGEGYGKLAPVYSLNIVNQLFSQQKSVWYHHYKLSHQKLRQKHLAGMEFVFLELPNFRYSNELVKRKQDLWMRFMNDIKNGTTMIASDLLQEPAIAEALNVLEVSGYTKEELERYDKYWDIVNTQVSFIQDAEARGQKIGEARGEAKGEVRGSINTAKKVAVNLLKRGFSIGDVAEVTGLSAADVAALKP
ncbi:MAG: Rpn family recombination-promoting nuclease/putative transposase, partial [Bacteroidetes bacterium]